MGSLSSGPLSSTSWSGLSVRLALSTKPPLSGVSTVLGAPEGATRTARLIAREIADEAAGFENDALTSLEAGLAKTSPRETSPDDLSLAEATP